MSTAFERGQQAQKEQLQGWQEFGWPSLQGAMQAYGNEYLETLASLEEQARQADHSEEVENLIDFYKGLLSRLD